MTETVWLLDVDGVINATNPDWRQKPVTGSAMYDGFRYTLRWAPSLITEIQAIVASGLVEVVWCTTWCDEVRQLEKLWGLPELSVAFRNLATKYTGDAKRQAAEAVLRAGNRLVWTDDSEVPSYGSPDHWALRSLGDCLLIDPYEDEGLNAEHIAEIRAFIGMEKS